VSIRVDIAPLLKSVGLCLKIDEQETVSYPEDSLILTSPIHVKGEFLNTGKTILFSGKVKTTARLNCSRCLKEFDYPVSFDLEEEYSREASNRPGRSGEVRLKKEDFVFEVESDNTIDLSEAIRQDILTELPIMPLCEEKCNPGLPG